MKYSEFPVWYTDGPAYEPFSFDFIDLWSDVTPLSISDWDAFGLMMMGCEL